MDSQKLRVYETLHSLNQDSERVLTDLRSLQEFPFLRREFLRHFQVVMEETRAWANFEVTEAMHSREQSTGRGSDGYGNGGKNATPIRTMC